MVMQMKDRLENYTLYVEETSTTLTVINPNAKINVNHRG